MKLPALLVALSCASTHAPQRVPPIEESASSVALRQPGGPLDLSAPAAAHDAGYVWDMSHANSPPGVAPTSSMH